MRFKTTSKPKWMNGKPSILSNQIILDKSSNDTHGIINKVFKNQPKMKTSRSLRTNLQNQKLARIYNAVI